MRIKPRDDPSDDLIAWEPVLNTPTVQIAEYQVIVERLDVSPKRVFSIHVPASVTSIMVPPQFLESGLEYKFEVLSIETGRNQTIHESFFYTL